jgi:hypothetical protein
MTNSEAIRLSVDGQAQGAGAEPPTLVTRSSAPGGVTPFRLRLPASQGGQPDSRTQPAGAAETVIRHLTCPIGPDEFLGLRALIELDGAAAGGGASPGWGIDVAGKAGELLRSALADKLGEAGLPWAPSAQATRQRAAEAAQPGGVVSMLAGNEKVRKAAAYILAVAGLVTLWGGYVRGWQWTGFRSNGQVWDWLTLLLLPVVLGTIPLWIKDRQYIGTARTVIYGLFFVACTGFVIAGYLIPISWTGFADHTLWDWIALLVLPATLAVTAALASRAARSPGRLLRPYEKAIAAALAGGFAVTVVGAYTLGWTWTGYAGNTLWDWLSKLLVPALFPTILLPALLRWISGNAAARASEAHQAAIVWTAAAGTAP